MDVIDIVQLLACYNCMVGYLLLQQMVIHLGYHSYVPVSQKPGTFT
jgi:hypothetical protein